MKHEFRMVSALALALAAAACAKESSGTQPPPSTSSANNDLPAVLATIDGQPVTLNDVRAKNGDKLDQMETQYQQARSKLIETALDDIVRERVLEVEAKKQGKTADQLILAEAGGTLNPTDEEVAAWYQANRARAGNRTLDQIRVQIGEFLLTQKRNEAAERLQSRLNAEHKVAINFQPYRTALENKGAPTLGKEGAPITLVEFSDFQCPFCNQFVPTLKEIEKNYRDKVRIVYRQYPIPSLHPFALKAAEASLCAQEQGKFWEMHDMMFAEQQKLAVTDLKEKARRLGMGGKKFDSCLDSGRYVEQVQKDQAEGSRVGVTGTPAIFINGAMLPGGAVPYATVAAAIDKELARTTPKSN